MIRIITRCSIALLTIFTAVLVAAPASRLTRAIEGGRARPVSGTANRQAGAQNDLGEAASTAVKIVKIAMEQRVIIRIMGLASD